jgi:hypothetical protein
LRQVILSQHKAYEPFIKDLGETSLELTTQIEDKKKSIIKLTEGYIPRSLKIGCELTTSKAYQHNQEFLQLKQELNDNAIRFQKEGADTMKKWSILNTKLLIQDRCTTILSKAIEILDGLTSYFIDNIGTPIWPSLTQHQHKYDKNNHALLIQNIRVF